MGKHKQTHGGFKGTAFQRKFRVCLAKLSLSVTQLRVECD